MAAGTFSDGVVGHVVGIWRRGDTAAAFPAFCPEPDTPEEDRPTPHLVLPFFEIGAGLTTLGVHNASAKELRVRYEYFDALGVPIPNASGEPFVEIILLSSRGTRLVDLSQVLGAAARTGFVHVTAVDPDGQPIGNALLHGEWLRRLEAGPDPELASGGALVDTRTTLQPPGLCQRWNVRFYNYPEHRTTTFLFYVEAEGAEDTLTGQIYDLMGEPMGTTPPLPLNQRSFARAAAELVPEDVKSGAIEWEFQGERKGYIASIHQAGALSVAIPAVCRDGTGDDP